MATVLLVEDDNAIRRALTSAFVKAGHVVSGVRTGLEALHEIPVLRPEMIVLDVGLPDMDGAVVLRMIRGESDVPVIVATARVGEADVIKLLNAGADDCIVKPFSSAYLLARISAVLRRTKACPSSPPIITIGSLQVDLECRIATLDGERLELTRKEFDMLAYLCERPNKVVTAKDLFEEVWRQPFRGREATLHVHVSWLRRKLGETAAQPRLLRTVRGVGLMLQSPSSTATSAGGGADQGADLAKDHRKAGEVG